MKVINQYICEKCGTKFTDENECKECEEHHVLPIGFNEALFVKEEIYPHRINVKMADGKVKPYYDRL